MSLPDVSNLHVSDSEAPTGSIQFPASIKDYVEARGYHLGALMRGDKVGMSHSKIGFRPLLVEDLPEEEREVMVGDAVRCSFYVDRQNSSFCYGDLALFIRPAAQAEAIDAERRKRWDDLNNPEVVYQEVDEMTRAFRGAAPRGMGQNSRVEVRSVSKVTDHVDNSAERALAQQAEALFQKRGA